MIQNSRDKLILSVMREHGIAGTPAAFLSAVDAWRELADVDPDQATPAESELIADLMGSAIPPATAQVALDALRVGGAQALLRLSKSARTKRANPDLREQTKQAIGQGRGRKVVRIG